VAIALAVRRGHAAGCEPPGLMTVGELLARLQRPVATPSGWQWRLCEED
jgi:hypothetical protein